METLWVTTQYLKKNIEEAESIAVDKHVKKMFFRCRMYFRLRILNADTAKNSYTKKRKLNKTIT